MGDGSLGSTWADAAAVALGHPVTVPRGGQISHLAAGVLAHVPEPAKPPSAHEEREKWLRAKTRAWAKGKPQKVSVFAFVDWLDSTGGAAVRGPAKARGAAKVQPDGDWQSGEETSL
jgi:hypothetical protein